MSFAGTGTLAQMNIERGEIREERVALLDAPARRRSRAVIVGVVVAIIAALALAWFLFAGGGEPAGAPKAEGGDAVPLVTVSVPGRDQVQSVITGTGSLAARREMPVGVAGEGGEVRRVLVEPGSWVKAGQVLATVDRSVQAQTAESLAAQVAVARADARIAQTELDRAQQLVGRGFISQADVDRRTATRDAALARLEVARAQLGETRARNNRLDIRAPAAGLVLTRAVEPGQIVSSASGTLFRIASGGQMELRAQLPETELARLSVGVPAEVTPVGSDQSFKGEVWQVSPVIDPQTRQGIARIALSYNDALRPGGFASARITAGATAMPQLPESAVLSDGRGNYVFIVGDDNRVVRRSVRVGEVSDEGVAIAEGLNGTEQVVMSAGAFLTEGQTIKPVRQARSAS